MFYQKRKSPYPSLNISTKDKNDAWGKKKPKKQKETQDVKFFIETLHQLKLGAFYRIKNTGTFDPVKKYFRKNVTTKGIPDIIGHNTSGRCVFIEAKYIQHLDKKKKLIFKVTISLDQIEVLRKAQDMGCIAGVAFNVHDAIAIARDDEYLYPRHPRTYCFMDKEWLEKYCISYSNRISILSKEKLDPVIKVTKHITGAK